MNEEVKVVSTEERIKTLEARVSALERIEKKRRTKKIISIIIKIAIFIIMLIVMYKLYLFIKPYFEQLTRLGDIKDNFNLNGNTLNNFDLNGLFE